MYPIISKKIFKKKKVVKKKVVKIVYKDIDKKISNLSDLISLHENHDYHFNHIDNIALKRIVPYIKQLNEMIGMTSVKNSIFKQIVYFLSYKKSDEYLHTCIMGPPGSGKTCLATILCDIYHNIGIFGKVSNKELKILHRDDLVGQYLGDTAIKTRKALTNCLGSVVFIDEVYSLGIDSSKQKDSFAKEAIDTLCSFLSEHREDFICIIAGYEEDVKNCFFSVNKGLERRFPFVHKIEKYTVVELVAIFKSMLKKYLEKWSLANDVDDEFLTKFFKSNIEEFKNFGGDVETFIANIKMHVSLRTFGTDEDKYLIVSNDFKIEKKKENNDKSYLCMYT